jgi:catechol 2,3-dioxygenase-like lactoylglutathione lyase family enzyme
MKLSAARVNVTDIAAAKRFYGEILGLKQLWDYGSAVGYDVGGPSLIIETGDPEDPEHKELTGRFTALSFDVADAAASYRALGAKGVEFLEPPEKQPWGGTLAHFKDPSGNVLTLVEQPKR